MGMDRKKRPASTEISANGPAITGYGWNLDE